MPRTTLTKTTALGAYGTYSADAADLVLTAADTTNGNQFAASGRDLIIVQNSGASAYTVTITSAPDAFGRTADITTYSLAAGEIAIFGPFLSAGWRQADGYVYLTASNVAIKFGIATLPQ